MGHFFIRRHFRCVAILVTVVVFNVSTLGASVPPSIGADALKLGWAAFKPDFWININRRVKKLRKYIDTHQKQKAMDEVLEIKWLLERYTHEDVDLYKEMKNVKKQMKKRGHDISDELLHAYVGKILEREKELEEEAKAELQGKKHNKEKVRANCSNIPPEYEFAITVACAASFLMFVPGLQGFAFTLFGIVGGIIAKDGYHYLNGNMSIDRPKEVYFLEN